MHTSTRADEATQCLALHAIKVNACALVGEGGRGAGCLQCGPASAVTHGKKKGKEPGKNC